MIRVGLIKNLSSSLGAILTMLLVGFLSVAAHAGSISQCTTLDCCVKNGGHFTALNCGADQLEKFSCTAAGVTKTVTGYLPYHGGKCQDTAFLFPDDFPDYSRVEITGGTIGTLELKVNCGKKYSSVWYGSATTAAFYDGSYYTVPTAYFQGCTTPEQTSF